MTETLGYKKFAVESGDWGAATASVIGQKSIVSLRYPLNLLP
jgi:hypothetical protein